MHRITIEFPPSDDIGYIHRVRNFAEDLFRQIELTGEGTVRDIDRATDLLEVRIRRSQQLGHGLDVIRRELDRHHLAADATVRRG
jgi:hypothetical protein